MRSKKALAVFAPHESQRFILPMTLVFVCLMAWVLIEQLLDHSRLNIFLVVYGGLSIMYILINHNLVLRTNNYGERYGFINAIIMGVILGLFTYSVPENAMEASHILIVLGIVSIAATSSRFHAYIAIALTFALSMPSNMINFKGY